MKFKTLQLQSSVSGQRLWSLPPSEHHPKPHSTTVQLQTWPQRAERDPAEQCRSKHRQNLEESAFPSAKGLRAGAKAFLLQQDSGGAAKSVLEWLHNKNVKVLQRPQSPGNVNPRENLWNDLKTDGAVKSRKVPRRGRCFLRRKSINTSRSNE